MSQISWISHFQERLTGFDELYRLSGSSLSPLGYALEQQRLPSDEYFAWAMNHYGLPHLQNRFFSESSSPVKVFPQWKNHYSWSSECFPVGQWDGHLIVACLEPPQDFPQSEQTIFVLAEFESLQSFWNQNFAGQKSVETVSAPVAQVSAPESSLEGLDLSSMPTTVQSMPGDDLLQLSEEPVRLENSENTDSPLELGESGIPEGLGENFKVPVLEKTNVTPSVAVANEPTQVFVTPPSDSLEHLELMDAPPEIPVVKPTPKPAPVVAQAPKAEPVAKEVPKKKKSEPLPPPPTPDTLLSSTVPPNVISMAKSKPNKPPATPSQFLLDKWKKKHGTQFSELTTSIHDRMAEHFQKSMIMSLDEKESQLMAFSWSDGFSPVGDGTARVNLGIPSIFNIVTTTQKPFHGYVSINEVNERFFEEWNQGLIPDHITIAPIIAGERVLGLLVGLGEKSAYNRTALLSTEKLAAEISDSLISLKVA